jgi:integrase
MIRSTLLQNSTARVRFAPREKPYWCVLEDGLHLGYCRAKSGDGSWIARRFLGRGKYVERGLGLADDLQKADGTIVLNFSEAQERAHAWWKAAERAELGLAPFGPYTVEKALHDFVAAHRGRRGALGKAEDRASARARILTAFGDEELTALSAMRIREWLTGLAKPPRLSRSRRTPNRAQKNRAVVPKAADTARARRTKANQALVLLKAVLNHAFRQRRVASDETWRKVKALYEAEAAVVSFLSKDQCRRLVNTCAGPSRNLVHGALVTGCRYGELIKLRTDDFDAEAGTLLVRSSKSSKTRQVLLSEEGRALCSELTLGHARGDLIFKPDDATTWRASDHRRFLIEASRRANIEPAANFYILRHTYAGELAVRGASMEFIAAQLGHVGKRRAVKLYAHLSPNRDAMRSPARRKRLGSSRLET